MKKVGIKKRSFETLASSAFVEIEYPRNTFKVVMEVFSPNAPPPFGANLRRFIIDDSFVIGFQLNNTVPPPANVAFSLSTNKFQETLYELPNDCIFVEGLILKVENFDRAVGNSLPFSINFYYYIEDE